MAPQPHNSDYNDLALILQSTINPLVSKLQTLETKVDNLNQDRVTRTDLEKLRGEIVGSFVDRASYEARHAALIDRNTALDMNIKDLRRDMDQDLQKIHDRLESGKQQIEDRIKQQSDAQLSVKDRAWLRWSQIAGCAGIVIALLDVIVQHVRFN